MNNDLEQFSKESLKELIEHINQMPDANGKAQFAALARIALAAKQAKPTFEEWLSSRTDTIEVDCGCVTTEAFYHWMKVAYEATPQPAHTEQDGWIKCSEQMPDETENADGGATGYLVRYENDRVPNGGFNIDVSNCVFLRTHWRGLYTHWMPLPAAPKPESEL